MNWIFWISEIGIAALFVLCAFVAWKRRDAARSLSVLVSAALFAWIFENLNVHGVTGRGAYSYNEKFAVFLDRVPLFIVLSWAIILWTAMQIVTSSTRSLPQRVCRDASLAVLLDLGFDATAIRHEFWTWHGVALNEAWFGVPAGNFFGWLWVSIAFSYGTRVLDREVKSVRTRNILQIFILPPLAFVAYRGIETITNFGLAKIGWNPQTARTDATALWAFAMVFCVVVAIALWPTKTENSNIEPNIEYSNDNVGVIALWLAHATRWSFHAFAIGGLLVLPASTPFLAQQKPALLAVAGLMFVADLLYLRLLRRKTISRQ